MGENGQDQGDAPSLSPHYRPPEEDSAVFVRFAGNTAQIIDFNTKNIDAFQLLALAAYLEMKGKQTIVAIEARVLQEQAEREARSKIAIAGRIPDEEAMGRMPPGMRPR
jgi:hypothetical protein